MINVKKILTAYVLLIENWIFGQKCRPIVRALRNFQEFDVTSEKF